MLDRRGESVGTRLVLLIRAGMENIAIMIVGNKDREQHKSIPTKVILDHVPKFAADLREGVGHPLMY